MKLEFAFLADAAMFSDDGRFAVVGGGFDLIRTESFPAVRSVMALVGRIGFAAKEMGKVYDIRAELIGPDGNSLPPEMLLAIATEQQVLDEKKPGWVTICFNYQGVSFPSPGKYSIRLSVEKDLLGEVYIQVTKAKP